MWRHDRSRADDYYLAEGAGIARRFAATPGRPCHRAGSAGRRRLRVVGRRPRPGDRAAAGPAAPRRARGAVRRGHRERAEVLVARGRAAPGHRSRVWRRRRTAPRRRSSAGSPARHRPGSGRGARRSPVPVELIEAATIRHYTSRAGDPHRHLHLQVNARVLAAGKWRGYRHGRSARFDRGDQRHRARRRRVRPGVPGRAGRARLHPERRRGDRAARAVRRAVLERAAQIAANIDRYEAQWRTEHPRRGTRAGVAASVGRAGVGRGPAGQGRPAPRRGSAGPVAGRTAALGYRDRDRADRSSRCRLAGQSTGTRGRPSRAPAGCGRSAWNAADVRGEVEQLLARAGIVADPAVRLELAEDLTARAARTVCRAAARAAECPSMSEPSPPSTCSTWKPTSSRRLAARGAEPCDRQASPVSRRRGCRGRPTQAAAVAALAGNGPLVLVEGAAGAGKTTMLAVDPDARHGQDRRLVVVTPTLKAARSPPRRPAREQGSAAWLAYQHGWRWDDDRPLDPPATRRHRPGHRTPVSGPARAATRPGICCWSTRPGCSTRTPPAPC